MDNKRNNGTCSVKLSRKGRFRGCIGMEGVRNGGVCSIVGG